MEKLIKELIKKISTLELEDKIIAINNVKQELHKISPFKAEPVDCVIWEKCENIHANDYNPNSVAPPEMKLLHISISEDGYTQPIVSMLETDGKREVVDGFHRHRVGNEYKDINDKLFGYLPVVSINESRMDKSDRIASTIRHNRARGKHKVTAMSDVVLELKRRNWSDQKISKQLGMDSDEVLRLTQITGLAEMFSDKEFSNAWDLDSIIEDDNIEIEEENL